MNDVRVENWLTEMFEGLPDTKKMLMQKEKLRINAIDRIKEYMSNSQSFDDAFESAKRDFGDVDELISRLKEEGHEEISKGSSGMPNHLKFVALTPFIFILLGFAFGWWAWAWVIIPVSAILFAPMQRGQRFIALTPFIFVMGGFVFGWWAWGWVIIPVSAILLHDK
jgi:hypothetical protein